MVASPKTIAAATKLLEQYADFDSRIAMLEADRTAGIAAVNQRIDVAAEPMIQERDRIAGMLEAWWPFAVAADITKGKKSLQLGGCNIGMRLPRPSLAHCFESDDKAIKAVPGRWFKQATKIKYSLDRTSIVKLLQMEGGKAAAAFIAAGFRIKQEDRFFVERAEQTGAITS